jgi:hypothetical protein
LAVSFSATFLFAGKYLAEVSKGSVTFHPKKPKSLAISLNDEITLKLTGTPQLKTLKFSQGLLSVSSKNIWFFEIDKNV